MWKIIAVPIAFLAIIALSISVFGIWVWALFDVITSDRRTSEKLFWALAIIFLNFLGALIYLLFGRKDESGKKLARSKKNKIFCLLLVL